MITEKKPITVRDVAEFAGVSPATVSRVFNQNSSIKASTRQKVLTAADALGYSPKDCPSLKQNVLVMNIPSLGNPFYADIIEGAKSSAKHNNYTLCITEEEITPETLQDYLSVLGQIDAKGLIVLNYLDPNTRDAIYKKIPLVQCCEFDNDGDASCVGIDNVHAAEKAIRHLISMGHSKIAFFNGPVSYKYSEYRLRGYKKVLKEHNIELLPEWCINLPDVTMDYAYATAVRLLTGTNIPDAIFTASDICAAGVIKAAAHKKFRVPEDIMVVGFDNTDISNMTMPTITTINQPRFQMGFVACNLLCEKILNPDAEQQTILMETELIIRESTSIIG